MKKILFVLSVALIGALTISSCRKYEEGPNISLRKKEARVTNNWRVESAQLNGTEVSADPYWTKQKHYMYRDGNYVVTIINPVTLEAKNLQGTWKLYDNDRKLALTTKNFSGNIDSTNDYNILKLYNKQMWIRKTDNSLELHFVPFE
jgi:hypothetical protein